MISKIIDEFLRMCNLNESQLKRVIEILSTKAPTDILVDVVENTYDKINKEWL